MDPRNYLPGKPQYVLVRLEDHVEGPLSGGEWPHKRRPRTLTFHYFGKDKLIPGDRVCVNAGYFANEFGTVVGRSWRWPRSNRYTYGVRRTVMRRVTLNWARPEMFEFEVAP